MKLVLAFALFTMLVLPQAFAASSSITVNGKTHNVTYEATGLTVDGLEADTTTATLTVSVTTIDTSSTLQMVLDRNFFDSRTGNTDDDFLVLADGTDAQFTDDKTDTTRTLTITVPSGTNSIDIISLGTANFGSGSTTPEPAPPAETQTPSAETQTPPPAENQTATEPTTQCGPGTILKDGACVVETPVTPEPEPQTQTTSEPAPSENQTTTEPTKECGPGTVLKDGQCVLDQSCGPGTILKDGQCVLETSPSSSLPQGQSTQFVIGIIGAFIIAFVLMMILWAIGKAGRRKH